MATSNKAGYVDGFVFVVPKKNAAAYKKMATEGAQIWRKFGALDYKECKGDDLKSKGPDGKQTPMNFMTLTNVGATETVWFSFITYKNKAHRNAVNKKVMAYFDKKYKDAKEMSMPFDMNKMAFGGFSVIVQ